MTPSEWACIFLIEEETKKKSNAKMNKKSTKMEHFFKLNEKCKKCGGGNSFLFIYFNVK